MQYEIIKRKYGRQHIEWHVVRALDGQFVQRFWLKREAIAWILKQESK
jgi:hypothetical protein